VRRLAVAVGAIAVAAVLSGPAGAGVWKKLHRPLHIPQIAPGATCPTTPKTGPLPSGFSGTAAFGPGPVYPGFFSGPAGPEAVVPFAYPPPAGSPLAGSQWSGQKVPWMRSPRYHGPVLIRGRQLDGPYHLRFGGLALVPPTELKIAGWGRSTGAPGWGFRASTTRLRAPGCYGYQIDGLTFSRVIVFRAVLWNSP
jgi:hypothetical protein